MRTTLPTDGLAAEALDERLTELQGMDWDHLGGRLPLHCYYAGEAVHRVAAAAAARFANANALAPQAFPSCQVMERDVVGIALDLLGAPADASGSLTSGGTESIILAVKAARDRAIARQVRGPLNIVIPMSAHPAFDKAAHLLAMHTRRIAIGADYRGDPAAIEAAMDDRTVLIAGSAPSLPFGTIDPLAALGALGQRRRVWVHVDACIGGMLMPFVRELGYPVPACDFAIDGVTSMSCDLHKFGYAAKGASLVLYRDRDDHAFQLSRHSAWPKGEYVTPTLAGTRSGAPIASAWAVMHFLGRRGYLEVTRAVMQLRDRFLSRFAALPVLEVLGRPELSVITVASSRVDIFEVADGMRERGWYMSLVAEPNAIQQTVNLVHERTFEAYFADVEDVLRSLAPGPRRVERPARHVVTY